MKVTPKTVFNLPAQQRVPYVYNKVSDLVKKVQTTTVFGSDEIIITSESRQQTQTVLDKLTEMGAKFVMKTLF